MTGTELISAPGYLSETLLVYALGASGPAGLSGELVYSSGVLLPDAVASAWATQAGFTYPANGTAFIQVGVGIDGATATLSPPSGIGPIYTDADGTPDPSLTATVHGGSIVFGNVTPGAFTLTVSENGVICSPTDQLGVQVGLDWPVPAGSPLEGVTFADAFTDGMRVICP